MPEFQPICEPHYVLWCTTTHYMFGRAPPSPPLAALEYALGCGLTTLSRCAAGLPSTSTTTVVTVSNCIAMPMSPRDPPCSDSCDPLLPPLFIPSLWLLVLLRPTRRPHQPPAVSSSSMAGLPAPSTHIILPYLRLGGVRIKANVPSPSCCSSTSPKMRLRRVDPHSRTSSQPLDVISAPAAQK